MDGRIAPACRGGSFLGLVLLSIFALGAKSFAAEFSQFARWTGPAPAFALEDSAGAKRRLEPGPDGIVIVHFFATWCEPCREELPALSHMARQAGPSVRVIAISVAEPDMRVRRFVSTTDIDFPILLDRDRATARAWRVSVLPTSFVLDGRLAPHLVAERSVDWDGVAPDELARTINTSAFTQHTGRKQQ